MNTRTPTNLRTLKRGVKTNPALQLPAPPAPATVCELRVPARFAAKIEAWAEIARACADDVGLTLEVHSRIARKSARFAVPTLTLELPVEFAASQHPAWCLACRLACFCPSVRVSVLVRSEHAFRPTESPPHAASA